MRGSVIQKPKGTGKWYVVLDLPRDGTARRRQKWHRGYAGKREAERALAALLAAAYEGSYVDADQADRRAVPDRALAAGRGRSPCGRRRWSATPAHRAVPGAADRRGAAAGPDAGPGVGALPRAGRGRRRRRPPAGAEHCAPHPRDPAPGAARRAAGATRRATRRAPRPSRACRAWGRTCRCGATEEVARFLAAVRADRLYARLAPGGVDRACAAGELLGLRWQDVDLALGRPGGAPDADPRGYEVVVGEPKTRRSRRSVALDRDTVAVLREWRAGRTRSGWRPDRLAGHRLRVHPRGRAVRAPGHVLSYWFEQAPARPACARSGCHDLRHTHASLALQAGVSAKVVSDRLGHSSVAFTLDVYSHVVPALQEEAAERVAGLFRRA